MIPFCCLQLISRAFLHTCQFPWLALSLIKPDSWSLDTSWMLYQWRQLLTHTQLSPIAISFSHLICTSFYCWNMFGLNSQLTNNRIIAGRRLKFFTYPELSESKNQERKHAKRVPRLRKDNFTDILRTSDAWQRWFCHQNKKKNTNVTTAVMNKQTPVTTAVMN